MAATPPSRPPARLVHISGRRVRVRLEREARGEDDLEQIRRHLEAHPAVEAVAVSRRTGSVVVTGDHVGLLREALEGACEVIEQSGPEGDVTALGADTAVALVKKVDGKLGEATGGRLSLRWLVPASFIGVGVRQLLSEGFSVGAVPWYVLLYYGVDSFLKLYPHHAPQAPPRFEVLKRD